MDRRFGHVSKRLEIYEKDGYIVVFEPYYHHGRSLNTLNRTITILIETQIGIAIQKFGEVRQGASIAINASRHTIDAYCIHYMRYYPHAICGGDDKAVSVIQSIYYFSSMFLLEKPRHIACKEVREYVWGTKTKRTMYQCIMY